MKLTVDKANKVYDILVSKGGAKESERQNFVHLHCEDDKADTKEWRFKGKLGFGGKYKSDFNKVTYYPEDETPLMKKTAEAINRRLKVL